MKRYLLIGLGVVLISGAAIAAAYAGGFSSIWTQPGYAKAGIFIGSGSPTNTLNKLTRTSTGSGFYDFTTLGNVALEMPCEESFPVTLNGTASFRDQCLVSSNLGMDGGAALAATATLSCSVTAANTATAKLCVRFTDAGTYNLHDAGFFFQTFSNQ